VADVKSCPVYLKIKVMFLSCICKDKGIICTKSKAIPITCLGRL
jgi:hypothetical protein